MREKRDIITMRVLSFRNVEKKINLVYIDDLVSNFIGLMKSFRSKSGSFEQKHS